MRKPFVQYANTRGVDKPAHSCSLISTFVVRCLDGKIPLVSLSEISSPYLASVAVKAGLSLFWSQTPEDRFSRDEAQLSPPSCFSVKDFKYKVLVAPALAWAT